MIAKVCRHVYLSVSSTKMERSASPSNATLGLRLLLLRFGRVLGGFLGVFRHSSGNVPSMLRLAGDFAA